MFNISNFLSKFAKLGHGEQAIIEETKVAVQEVLHFSLEGKAIRFANGVVNISAPAVAKSEIFLHKEEILEKLRQKIQKPKILDIK
ncbi:MAG: hypothetical protein WCT25_03255 [Candidatus Paceibacterota bacterium]|jgi:hypothetical protein